PSLLAEPLHTCRRQQPSSASPVRACFLPVAGRSHILLLTSSRLCPPRESQALGASSQPHRHPHPRRARKYSPLLHGCGCSGQLASVQATTGSCHVDEMRSAADASWASCARHRFRPGILSFRGTQRLLHGCRSLHIVHRLIHIGEKPGLTCCVVQSRSEAFRAPELELLICAVSSVTWL